MQVIQKINPSLAQSGSASGLGPEGREFESLNSDQVCRAGSTIGGMPSTHNRVPKGPCRFEPDPAHHKYCNET